jgi:dTDP-L-rhamnose 4-epimerase
MRILVTGGLGFIGSRIVGRLLQRGDEVVVLDNLHPQVHTDTAAAERLRALGAEVVIGDVRDRASWALADDVDAVFHMAAETGTGQSMAEVVRYCEVNVSGTAQLCEAVHRSERLRRIFLPGSRAIYGEGLWRCGEHGDVVPPARRRDDLAARRYLPACPICERILEPLATREETPPRPASVYATTKLVQEQILRQTCDAAGRDLRIARYQNVYGPGQALGNPYTGVLAIFARQISEGRTLDIYEDGGIARDFVFIDDVVEASLAIFGTDRDPGPVNVGTGSPTTLLDVVQAFASAGMGEVSHEVTGHFRDGDVRYAVADVTRLRATWGTTPIPFATGLARYVDTLRETLLA